MGTRLCFEIAADTANATPAVRLYSNNSHPDIDPASVFRAVALHHAPGQATKLLRELLNARYLWPGGTHQSGDAMFRLRLDAPAPEEDDVEAILRAIITPTGETRVQQRDRGTPFTAHPLVDAAFRMDEEGLFRGVHTPSVHWNGWACPAFIKGVAQDIVAHYNHQAGERPYAWYDAARDAFVFVQTDVPYPDGGFASLAPADLPPEHDTFAGATGPDGVHRYAIGAWSWTWTAA